MKERKVVRTIALNGDRYNTVQALGRARLLPASWEKRFVRTLAAQPLGSLISDKQAHHLDRLAHRYRRQIGITSCGQRWLETKARAQNSAENDHSAQTQIA
jgi:hypothetical protein